MVLLAKFAFAILLAVKSTASYASIDANSFLQLFAHSHSDETGIIAEYLGCFNDDSDHDLDYNPSGQFSVTGCMKECLYTRYNFMALQDRGLCYCGNSYASAPQYSKLPDSQCDSTCENNTKDDENSRCGKRFANAIYEIQAQSPAPTTSTDTTITASSTTMSTVTMTSTTITGTSTTQEGQADQTGVLHDNTCMDQEVTNFTIGGHPVHCSKLLHYCMKPEKTEAMQNACPASCGLCKPYWIGCFHDDPDEHDFDVHPPGQHTTRTCMQACAGFKYMALQGGSDCWCGMEYSRNVDRYFQVLDSDCGEVCEDEVNMTPTRYCGATRINAVYRLPVVKKAASHKKRLSETNDETRLSTPSTPSQSSKVAISEWMGCFHDSPDRPFLVQPRGKHTTMSCMLACINFTYIALQNMGTCWCGNSYVQNSSKHDQLQDKMCGDVCHGEASLKPVRYCGGDQANAVYRLQVAKQSIETETETATQTEIENSTEKAEMKAQKAKQVYGTFLQFDGNHDGVVTLEELKNVLMVLDDGSWSEARITKLVSDVDQNDDQQLQLNEFETFFNSMQDVKNAANDVSGQTDDNAQMGDQTHMPMFPVTQEAEQANMPATAEADDTAEAPVKDNSPPPMKDLIKDAAAMSPDDIRDAWNAVRNEAINSSVPSLPKEVPVAVHVGSANMTNSSNQVVDAARNMSPQDISNVWKKLRNEAGNANVGLP